MKNAFTLGMIDKGWKIIVYHNQLKQQVEFLFFQEGNPKPDIHIWPIDRFIRQMGLDIYLDEDNQLPDKCYFCGGVPDVDIMEFGAICNKCVRLLEDTYERGKMLNKIETKDFPSSTMEEARECQHELVDKTPIKGWDLICKKCGRKFRSASMV